MATAQPGLHLQSRKGRRALIVLGVLALALGAAGLFMTAAMTIASTLWFGALFAVAGVVHLIHGIRESEARWLNLLLGALYLLGGIAMLLEPVRAAISITLLLGVMLAVFGIARAIWSFWYPGWPRKLLGVAGGLISVALGWIILSGWPVTGLWVLGLFVSIDLLVYGLTMILAGARRD